MWIVVKKRKKKMCEKNKKNICKKYIFIDNENNSGPIIIMNVGGTVNQCGQPGILYICQHIHIQYILYTYINM